MKSKAIGGMAAAMAIAGRAARPCDVCGRERARWYCAADEAYLCETCDGSVHNANALASRHERVRLSANGAPMKIDRHRKDETTSTTSLADPAAGGDRLAIISRKKQFKDNRAPLRASAGPPATLQANSSTQQDPGSQAFEVKLERSSPEDAQIYFDELPGDPRSPPCREGKGEPDYAHEFMVFDECEVDEVLTPEECEGEGAAGGLESSAGDFDALSPTAVGEQEDSEAAGGEMEKPEPGMFLPLTSSGSTVQSSKEDEGNHVPSLRLNYADILNAWSDRGTLWTGGHAQTVPEDTTSDALANPDHGVVPLLVGEDGNSAREARVNRYREKRRTRLFSKKIRYEVRKLNAERRPRMKGRFVKRSAGEQ
ncbi:hypothetical protein Mapa_013549 [Marchantia paleacea]|nr:hypothetical protein Mapa_013549 [Marchantia paleacea]